MMEADQNQPEIINNIISSDANCYTLKRKISIVEANQIQTKNDQTHYIKWCHVTRIQQQTPYVRSWSKPFQND